MTETPEGDTPNTPDPAPANPESPVMPDGLSENFWDAESGQVKLDDLIASHTELSTFKQTAEEQFANRPETADAYELSLPEGFELPEGVNFEFQPDSALAKLGRDLAFAKGLSQQDFQEQILKPYIEHELGKIAQDETDAEEFAKAEVNKLGEQGQERLDAVDNWLQKSLSEDAYKALQPATTTAAGIEALEILMKGSGAPVVQTTGSPAPADKITQEKLTEMQNDPRYWQDRDPAFVKQVQDGYAKLYPGQQQRIT